jgi:predicted dehydrogenase
MAFYDEIASILLGNTAMAVAGPVTHVTQQQQQQQQEQAVADPAGGGAAAAAGGAGGISSMLSVRPEQAAAVIRLIEVAMQSSKEGRTIRL